VTASNDFSNVVSIPIESLKQELLMADDHREVLVSESVQEELNRSLIESSKNTQSANGIARHSEPKAPQSKQL